jgi:hypothetical protein
MREILLERSTIRAAAQRRGDRGSSGIKFWSTFFHRCLDRLAALSTARLF